MPLNTRVHGRPFRFGTARPIATVDVSNVETILGQWCRLHGLGLEPTRREIAGGYPRRVWCDADGRELVEAYAITGMGHGTPLETRGIDGYGVSGSFMLDVRIGSTLRIARFWGLAPPEPIAHLAVKIAESF